MFLVILPIYQNIINVAEYCRDTLQYIVHHLLEDLGGAGDPEGKFVKTIPPKGCLKSGKQPGRFCKGNLPNWRLIWKIVLFLKVWLEYHPHVALGVFCRENSCLAA